MKELNQDGIFNIVYNQAPKSKTVDLAPVCTASAAGAGSTDLS